MASRVDQSAQNAERAAGAPSDQAGHLLPENATKGQVKQCKELVADFLRKTLTKKPLARRLPFTQVSGFRCSYTQQHLQSGPAANRHVTFKRSRIQAVCITCLRILHLQPTFHKTKVADRQAVQSWSGSAACRIHLHSTLV